MCVKNILKLNVLKNIFQKICVKIYVIENKHKHVQPEKRKPSWTKKSFVAKSISGRTRAKNIFCQKIAKSVEKISYCSHNISNGKQDSNNISNLWNLWKCMHNCLCFKNQSLFTLTSNVTPFS